TARSPLDELRSEGKLTNNDVPLAALTWTGSAADVVDQWSVRRRPVPARTLLPALVALVGERPAAQSQAEFMRFDHHLAKGPGPSPTCCSRPSTCPTRLGTSRSWACSRLAPSRPGRPSRSEAMTSA